MARKNSVIVLSGYLTPERQMDEESRRRVDKGIDILKTDVDFIVMNGGPGRFADMSPMQRGSHPVHSEVMRDYAIAVGVPPELISIQDFSSDTFGEAYFCKEGILVPRRFSDNIVVSSRYHIPRTRVVYNKILGDAFSTDFEYVETDKDNDPIVLANEETLTRLFLSQTGWIPDGNSRMIEHTLYDVHPSYRSIPEAQRLKFY